ncbi:MAG: TadE/TadG family type IV pilus assembly protein [Caenibius sp.]
MMTVKRLRAFFADQRGTMAIETVFVLPILIALAVGGFEVSNIVSRQQELQSGASEAEAIILAAAAGTGTDSATLRTILHESLDIPEDNITLDAKYRCGTAATLSDTGGACGTAKTYQFIQMNLVDTYTPLWARYGVGSAITYNVTRTIQVG